MRRGCISLGETRCDQCQRDIPHAERYLAVDEEEGVEVEEGGTTAHYCIECAIQKGYAYHKEEKDEKILTIFPRSEY